MKSSLLLVTAAALALTACGDNNAGETTATTAETTTEATTDVAAADAAATADATLGAEAGTAPTTSATPEPARAADSYVTNAALSDMYEIASSRLAIEKATSPDVKKYAQQMIAEHTATSDQLKSTMTKAGLKLTPPAQLDSRRQEMLNDLRSASADRFDTAYLDQQTAAHQEALTLHSDYAKDGENAALKQLAAATSPKIQQHLDMVKKLDRSGADEQTSTGKAK